MGIYFSTHAANLNSPVRVALYSSNSLGIPHSLLPLFFYPFLPQAKADASIACAHAYAYVHV